MHIKNRNAFTLAEVLIVLAIIAVLVAVSIPILKSQLEKSREASDLANVRSAYAEITSAAISQDTSSKFYNSTDHCYVTTINLIQTEEGWRSASKHLSIGDIDYKDDVHWLNEPKKGGTCKLYYDIENDELFIDWGGESKVSNSPNIDYNSSKSVGLYIFEAVQKQLDLYVDGSQDDPKYTQVFSRKYDSAVQTSVTLPNGQNVTVNIYNRNYDKFQDKPTRLTSGNTASFIYNRSSGKLTTIIYYNGKNYSSWTYDSDYGKWKETDSWKDNDY